MPEISTSQFFVLGFFWFFCCFFGFWVSFSMFLILVFGLGFFRFLGCISFLGVLLWEFFDFFLFFLFFDFGLVFVFVFCFCLALVFCDFVILFVVAYCTLLLSQAMYNLMMAAMAETCSCQLPSTIQLHNNNNNNIVVFDFYPLFIHKRCLCFSKNRHSESQAHKMLGVDPQKITDNETQTFMTSSSHNGRQNTAWNTR